MNPQYTRRSKFELVGEWLHGRSGRLLDVGARDRILQRYLDTARIQYLSSDLCEGHDYRFDLERPLPLPDRSFDFVAALDVLEHLEHAHAALAELMRVARREVFLSLPNLGSLKYRAQFLFTGRIGGKYLLLPEHQGDRHRWLPIYADIYPFVSINARRHGFQVTAAFNGLEFGGPLNVLKTLSNFAAALGIEADGLFTNTVIVSLRREETRP